MATPLKEFQKNCRASDKRAIQAKYRCLVGDPNQTPPVKEKLEWLKKEYPWLTESNPISEEVAQPGPEVEQGRPYHVGVAEKYLQLYRSATRRGKDFDLMLKDVHKLLQQKTCYYTGVAFDESADLHRTVDRIDNNKGYVKGNVVACTRLANQMKEQIFERPTQQVGVNISFIAKVTQKVLEHTGGDA